MSGNVVNNIYFDVLFDLDCGILLLFACLLMFHIPLTPWTIVGFIGHVFQAF